MYLRKTLLATVSVALLLVLTSGAPLKADTPAVSTSLGTNVTLHFEIEGTGMTFTVMTAKSTYLLNSDATQSTRDESAKRAGQESNAPESAPSQPSEGPTRASDALEMNTAEFKGEVSIDQGSGIVLVTCTGSFHVSHRTENASGHNTTNATDEVRCDFEASARFKPGEKQVLARSGDTALVLRVEIAE